MVIDTSAVMAVLRREADAGRYARAIEQADVKLMSAVSALEAGIVALARKGPAGAQHLDAFLMAAGIDVVAFDADMAGLAREAYARFGKGRHPAALNFGDCASYALAASQAMPLLFKGDDFGRTDLEPVTLPG